MSVLEKRHYPFRAYPRSRACHDILFPGCALPSQFPLTTDELARLCREHGMGVVYDCCGKPLEDWDENRSAERAIAGLRRRLSRVGCTRLVLACPNCLDYLEPRLGVPCISIYDVFAEWGLVAARPFRPGLLFVPCPDRGGHSLEHKIRSLGDLSSVKTMRAVPCCGLRADVAKHGPKFAQGLGERIMRDAGDRVVYTYCASCLGQFARLGHGSSVRHVLSALLGIDEEPDATHALANRARRRFDRLLEPIPQDVGPGCRAGDGARG